jgi:hypothetical protein
LKELARDSAIFQAELFASRDVKECGRNARIYSTAVYRNERMIK